MQVPFQELIGDHFGVDVKRNGDHFGVGIISGSIWGSFQGWGSFRGLYRPNLNIGVTILSRNMKSPTSHPDSMFVSIKWYRAFSHDITAAILVFQNNETAAILVYQDKPVGVEFFSYANAFFCSNKFA